MHNCYACGRVFSYTSGRTQARFPVRFEGPPGAVNGGIAVGAMACPALKSADALNPSLVRVSARLGASVRVEEALTVLVAPPTDPPSTTWEVSLEDGERSVARAWVEITAGRHPPRADDEHAIAGEDISSSLADLSRTMVPAAPPFFEELGEHSVPGCFSCGPENPDGMHIYPRFAGDGIVCAPWEPPPEFDDGNGAISPMIVASALDCSSGICLPRDMHRQLIEQDRFFLLGSLNVVYLRLPSVAREYRITGRMVRRDGRKFFGLSALFDDAGTAYAYAEATWIVAGITRTEAFGTG